jgi:3-oxoacyl-[acyl-carrier protein] reductase
METPFPLAASEAFSVRGRIVLVTGAAGFIGGGIARAFAANGSRVALSDVAGEPLEQALAAELREGREAIAVPGDLADPAGPAAIVRGVVERFGGLDVLINCAGLGSSPPLDQETVEHADRLMDVNVRAVWLLIQTAVEPLSRGGDGRVVNIASVNGHRASFPCPVYAASKAGVLALTRELAVELAPRGIRVNSISPGLIANMDRDSSWVGRYLREPYARQFLERAATLRRHDVPLEQPLPLCGTPFDVAMACLYLCSPAARFVTGADLLVDGGRINGMPDIEPRFRQKLTADREALRRELESLPADAWIRKPYWLK